ncbi:uncharacterized protein [Spinacia oleracea]|uniref:No apical meristem-associated C-terminal domain-containing protein n=1 Tax=Spinacia oleracea TaxID=3562 RepID=A0A9R0JXL5_SPIOL|nr:uncharacterized protein LOC110790349 [Spinacia oleracea]
MDHEDPYNQYYNYLGNSQNIDNQNPITPPPNFSNPQTSSIRPTPYNYPSMNVNQHHENPYLRTSPPYPPNTQMNYNFGYYNPPMVRPGYNLRPLNLTESFISHENIRRDSVGGSSMQEESLTPRLGAESQSSQNEADLEETSNQANNKNIKLKWSHIKDVDLCKSWITISKDPIKGNDQTKELYWKNIVEYYNTWKREDPVVPVDKASNHWFKMSDDQVLRNDPKWQEFVKKEGVPSKRTQTEDVEVLDKRPIVQKAAKEAARKRVHKKDNEIVSDTWTKFEDLANKRLSLIEDHIRQSDYELLCKDTSNMDERVKKNHEQKLERPRREYVPRDREGGAERLYQDYFSTEPVYPEHFFRRRFRMSMNLFNRIVEAVGNHSQYFKQKVDAAKRMGLSPLQKCTAAIRILAYGSPADVVDEYIKIGESTSIECLFNFCRAVIEVFGDVYMRRPNDNDVQRLLQMHEEYHGFPGMLGSLDCMHWAWKNCPTAWKGQYTRGDYGYPTIMLEAVASVDLWIWHAYFGVAGSNNDLNVLSRSNLFQETLQGRAPQVNFIVNETEYNMGYYLTDGIYPEWAAFVKTFSHPQDPKRLLFKKRHESARKDVERAFGVLQARFAIVHGPARCLHKRRLHDIMEACVILHNMIVEDERHTYARNFHNDFLPTVVGDVHQGNPLDFQAFLERDVAIRDRQMHHQLKADLVEHIWSCFGGQSHD